MQVPAPLQVGARRVTPVAQKSSPQAVSVAGKRQALGSVPLHRPSHAAVPPQVGRTPCGRPATFTQRPTLDGLLHASHWRPHVLSQHTPSTQKLLPHWLALAHGVPGRSFVTQTPAEQ
jgi:hypothetical protein